MWSEVFSFLAGGVVATTCLWNLISRVHGKRARASVVAAERALDDLNKRFETELVFEQRRAQEYFQKIEEVCGERNRIYDLYQRMGVGYGNAQDLMITTIDGMARQLEKLGHKAKIPGIIRAVRDEFFESHVTPVQGIEKEASAEKG